MTPAPLPALPKELMRCIARATLVAEGSKVQVWARLSLVCRAWREHLQGKKSARGLDCALAFAWCQLHLY